MGGHVRCWAVEGRWSADWPALVNRFDTFGSVDPAAISATNYPLALERCERQATTPAEFWEFISREVCTPRPPSEAQIQLARAPFDLFVSLNYDCIIEGCLASSGVLGEVMTHRTVTTTALRDGALLYLHGRCPDGRYLAADDVVLRRSEYDEAYDEGSDLWPALEAIFRYFNVLLIGTSMSDPDIVEVVKGVSRRERLRGGRSAGMLRLAFASTKLCIFRQHGPQLRGCIFRH